MEHVQKLITELTAIDRCPTVVEKELQNVEDIWMMSELFISFLHSHLSDPLVPYELGTFVIRSLHLSHFPPSNVSHRWMYIPITFSSHLLLLSPHELPNPLGPIYLLTPSLCPDLQSPSEGPIICHVWPRPLHSQQFIVYLILSAPHMSTIRQGVSPYFWFHLFPLFLWGHKGSELI